VGRGDLTPAPVDPAYPTFSVGILFRAGQQPYTIGTDGFESYASGMGFQEGVKDRWPACCTEEVGI
jgi:hypothetical protein